MNKHCDSTANNYIYIYICIIPHLFNLFAFYHTLLNRCCLTLKSNVQTCFVGLPRVTAFLRMPKSRKMFYANYNNNDNILSEESYIGSSTRGHWILSKNHITLCREGKN